MNIKQKVEKIIDKLDDSEVYAHVWHTKFVDKIDLLYRKEIEKEIGGKIKLRMLVNPDNQPYPNFDKFEVREAVNVTLRELLESISHKKETKKI